MTKQEWFKDVDKAIYRATGMDMLELIVDGFDGIMFDLRTSYAASQAPRAAIEALLDGNTVLSGMVQARNAARRAA